VYHHGSRTLQEIHDTLRLADRLQERSRAALTAQDAAFIAARDMMFVATADDDGHPTCSYKGGDPGFVRVLDEQTLGWTNYDGNGMFLSLGNITVNPFVGLLFMDWDAPARLRVHGTAELAGDEVRVAVDRVFPNCPRYIHRMALVERSVYVPREGAEAPVPAWKRTDWARDVLPGT
jgi:predicted pyridoxine 5'-phosphate oxidase superfamily flavin-nucleotide-binding protein